MFSAPNLVALLAVLAPLAAPQDKTTASAALSMQVQPPELRLAEGGRVRVRVASPDEPPVLSANVGRLEGLHETSSGIYEAEFAPPEGSDPLIAIVTALTPGGKFGVSHIALYGARTVEVRAPHRALVSVVVGGETFGPVPADGTGRAVLRVDVPPGVASATALNKRLDLDVPRRAFAHVALDRGALQAGAAAEVAVRIVALGDRGEPLTRAPVKLEPSQGTVTKPIEIAPGVYKATWSIAPGRVGESRLIAKVGTSPQAIATGILRRVAGEPAAVVVETDRSTLVAGDGDELSVRARVVDAAGNTTDAPAKLIVSMGSGASARLLPDAVIEWLQASADSGYVGRVFVPRQRSGRQQLELKVLAGKGLVGTRVVELVPGAPARVSVETEEDLFADGQRRQLRVVLFDKHGNRTDTDGGAAVVTATRGTVGTTYRSAAGVYVADYRPPVSTSDYEDVVRARVGPLEGTTELRVRARGGSVVLGVKGGYAMGSSSLSAPSGGVEVGYWPRWFGVGLGLVTDVRYFGFSRSGVASGGGISVPVQSDASLFALEPSLAWRRPLVGGLLWLGAGPGLMRVGTTVSVPGQPDLEASSWEPLVHASVGWGRPFGRGVPFAELKGSWKGEAADSGTALPGELRLFSVNLGYRFDVF